MKTPGNTPRGQSFIIGLVCAWLAWGLCGASARGDGGTVRWTQRIAGYEIAVFTAPMPVRAGLVDVSVLVQDADSGQPLPQARVSVRVVPRDRTSEALAVAATSEAATNKLLRAATVALPTPGWWEIGVQIDGPYGPANVRFEVEVAEPLPKWRQLWPWFSWPAAVVLLFSAHQFLVQRKSR